MKLSEIIEAIERLFLDIIAYVIPGASLILAAALIFVPVDVFAQTVSFLGQNGYLIWLFFFAAYVMGQCLETVGSLVTERIAILISNRFFAFFPDNWRAGLSPAFISRETLERKITKSDIFLGGDKEIENQGFRELDY